MGGAPAPDAAAPDSAPAHTEAETADAGGDASGIPFETAVPPTRRQSTAELGGAPFAPGDRLRFPDDDTLSRWMRVTDWGLGLAEQSALFIVLGVVVVTAA